MQHNWVSFFFFPPQTPAVHTWTLNFYLSHLFLRQITKCWLFNTLKSSLRCAFLTSSTFLCRRGSCLHTHNSFAVSLSGVNQSVDYLTGFVVYRTPVTSGWFTALCRRFSRFKMLQVWVSIFVYLSTAGVLRKRLLRMICNIWHKCN